jgi:hypothetical protein
MNKHNYTDLIRDRLNRIKLYRFDERCLKCCHCGITTKFLNYPNHCNSKLHQNYLIKNDIINVFPIQGIYLKNSLENIFCRIINKWERFFLKM